MAQNRYGCACLHNRTDVQINYRYRWGNAEWRTVNLPSNYSQAICWNYGTGQHASPALTFQVDADMTNGTAWSTYALTRVQSPGNQCNQVPSAGHYNISYRAGSNRSLIAVFKR